MNTQLLNVNMFVKIRVRVNYHSYMKVKLYLRTSEYAVSVLSACLAFGTITHLDILK